MDINIEQQIDKEYNKALEKLHKLDLFTHKPPFIPFTFELWREDAQMALKPYLQNLDFVQLQEAKRQQINMFDKPLLNILQKRMKQPYFELIFNESYQVPKEANIQTARKDYHLFKNLEKLASSIGDWCIQIELSCELIERAKIYKYYVQSEQEQEMYKKLTQQLQAKQHTSIVQYVKRFFKNTATFSIRKLSSFLWAKGVALSNISIGALILSYYSIIGTSSFPIQMLLPRTQISWLLGGLVSSYALNQVAEIIQRGEIAEDMDNVSDAFSQISIRLNSFNQKCEDSIVDCALCKDEEELQEKCDILKKIINEFLSNGQAVLQKSTLHCRDLYEKQDESDDDLTILGVDEEKQK